MLHIWENANKFLKKLLVIMISFSSKDVKNLLHALSFSEVLTNTCWMKSKGLFMIQFVLLKELLSQAKLLLEEVLLMLP